MFSYRHTWQPKNQLSQFILRDLLVFTENEQIPTVVETDANAHHTIWKSSDINPRGKDLFACCASADLNFCNVGNKPTFKTKSREEVLDLIQVKFLHSQQKYWNKPTSILTKFEVCSPFHFQNIAVQN